VSAVAAVASVVRGRGTGTGRADDTETGSSFPVLMPSLSAASREAAVATVVRGRGTGIGFDCGVVAGSSLVFVSNCESCPDTRTGGRDDDTETGSSFPVLMPSQSAASFEAAAATVVRGRGTGDVGRPGVHSLPVASLSQSDSSPIWEEQPGCERGAIPKTRL